MDASDPTDLSVSEASRRMADGALTRAQKELIATMVSAINVCEY